ncbi:ankyrin repeat and BTB/POZ domain-containing protein 1-like [Haliotis rufescens]|uniref:ankyrin repeat and BTB/POZ domain-containing protein 1-like n=1 Tax=Haliotis rufescens TaxID=6454 RepID=UPI001EAF9EF1|nr:ankyrin repeat and BTB/POZ domain-containing protein 1-like [Haliotis rufescens]XP_046362105.1 ankyrin repeat and BTB/POZ domain-containing protein 1-like [Haliotis rufescens]XP_046362863.1 ankyrin repeat and BTB/POZ domain-containing protein 1-like [Haliotis rufescens]XP_046363599.1 ankyrin repeat and BTB/POZ domain-containing protein 1-like [Haliotis rufescens]XP_046364399.1 ankyrin repeat and BTB/POZ domain-containing protein 1-like [Haliotis rufescens]XP_048253503.1 ankyrin repeat and B
MAKYATRETFAKHKDIFLCCRTGNLGNLKKLVNKDGVNLNITDEWGNPPLYLACLCGHIHVVEYLLQQGARYDASSIDGQRCFLSSLNQRIRDVLRQYETSLSVVQDRHHEKEFSYFLDCLYERVPGYDIQLIVDNHTFLAHRSILSARSAYFLNVFKSSTITNGTLELDVSFSVAGLVAVLQYIYTGKLDVSIEDVSSVRKLFMHLDFNKTSDLLDRPAQASGDQSVVHVQRKVLSEDLKEDFANLAFSAVPPQFYYQMPGGSGRPVGDELFSDVVFAVEGHKFQCHKVFFYSRSEYFRVMLIEKEADIVPSFEGYRSSITLEGVSAEDFVQIVSYIYTDTCQVTADNCMDLLSLSERFVLPGLKQQLLVEVSSCLKPLTVTSVYRTAKELQIPKLKDECASFMADNIDQMSTMPEFPELLKLEASCNTHSELIENIQYYIRKDSNTSHKQQLANHKLSCLQNALNAAGIQENVPFLMVETGQTTRSGAFTHPGRARKKSDSDCVIL